MKQLCIFLALLITSSTNSWAQESNEERLNKVVAIQQKATTLNILKQAWNSYKLGDYEAALGLWMPLAEAENPSAQAYIGLMYNQGHGVQQDISEAAKWFSLASDQGHAPAKWRLAMLYYHGSGLTQDYKKAVDLYHSAAKQGDVYSQKSLGVMYSKGFGVPKDNIIAYSWFHIARVNGFKLAEKYQNEMNDKMTPEETTLAKAMAKECMHSGYTKCGWLLSSAADPVEGDS